jgi:hypothetical protein
MSEQVNQLQPGMSFYQILEPTKVLGPKGETQYAQMGPFPDLASASQYSFQRPGSLITVILILHEQPRTPILPAKQN